MNPRPWRIVSNESGWWQIVDANGGRVLPGETPYETTLETAKLIVEAVNAYETMARLILKLADRAENQNTKGLWEMVEKLEAMQCM